MVRKAAVYLRKAAECAWHHRWTGILALCCVDGNPPPLGEVLGDALLSA